MALTVKFANSAQRQFYYATARNQCFSGGFNNGKTWAACLKGLTLVSTFPNYRLAICRQKYTDLKSTTMQTFFALCPPDLIHSHNAQDGITIFKNGSLIKWMHLDGVDEGTLRGLEMNAIIVDQAEEMDEKVYDVLDARVGRWAHASVPDELLNFFPDWPRSAQGQLIAPSYLMLLVNPDNQYHFVYRKYHPDSFDRNPDYFYCEGQWDPTLGSTETYEQALKHDPEWVEKYVKGQWGLSSAAIHYLPNSCILEPSNELLSLVKEKGNLSRVLDHGDSAPTCCLWFAAVAGVYICYREYYVGGKVISYHRQNIHDLSLGEKYSGNYADPQIFKKTAQKDGGFWSVSDEYRSSDVEGPSLFWLPADNNEFATRNRINELLKRSDRFRHPLTTEGPAQGLYFIKATPEYPNGCKEAIRQIGMQRKKLLGTLDGKSIYSDDREESVTDHAYDCVRYFVAMHGTQPSKHKKAPPRNSFAYYNKIADILKNRAPQPASMEAS